jgi:integrase/recombinase XerD
MEALSKPELLALLSAAKACRKRDWLMILTGYWHGLRASEVCAIIASDVADGQVTVARLKGSLKTTQPLMASSDPLLDEASGLIDFIAGMHPNQRVFPVSRVHFWRLVKKYAAAAGIAKRLGHPHILKHTIAMQTIQKAGIENVRQYLGHRSIASTGAYLIKTDQEASRAIAASVGTAEPSLNRCEFKDIKAELLGGR